MTPDIAPIAKSTSPPHSAADQMPNILASACNVPSIANPIAAVTITGSNRHVSTTARIAFNLSGGWYVVAASASAGRRRNRIGGLPNHDEPRLAFGGVADSTATSPSSGTGRPGCVMPELPRNARLPTVVLAA